MTALDYIGHGLVVLGITYGVVQSSLFGPVRVAVARFGVWSRMFIYCPFCVGFWIALVTSHMWTRDVWPSATDHHRMMYAFGWVGALLLARALWPALFDGSTHALESVFIDGPPPDDEEDDDPDDDEPADQPVADAANEEDHERTRKAA